MTQQEFEAYEALTGDEQLEIRSKMSDLDRTLHSCECVLYRIYRIRERRGKRFDLTPQERSAHYLSNVDLLLPLAMDCAERTIETMKKRIDTEPESSPPA